MCSSSIAASVRSALCCIRWSLAGAASASWSELPARRPGCQRSELLVALAQQATLAVQLTRLAYSAKEAAVLMERTRIGQEIHDGLAQAFTGILLQLGAVEEFPSVQQA